MPIPEHDLYGDEAPTGAAPLGGGSKLYQLDLYTPTKDDGGFVGFSGVFQVDAAGRVIYVPAAMGWLRGMRWKTLLERAEFQGATVTELTPD
jgi:hypothetical protein